MAEKIVLTGSPGTGKSSVILALEFLGEHVIHEAAEDYIKLRQACGVKEPWLEVDFQDRILDLQYMRERKIPAGPNRVFLDRGYHDGLAYAKPGSKQYKRIHTAASRNHYDKIFLIEQLGFTNINKIRRENNNEAIELGNKLEQIYQDFGYEVVRIGAGSVEERVEEILNQV